MTDETQTATLDGFVMPENGCVNYKVCGNEVPGAGEMCGECLDEARHRDAGVTQNV